MPDPFLYLAASAAALSAAALLTFAIGKPWPPAGQTRLRLASVLGLAGGLAAGYWVLHLRLAWPPANALDRFLMILLPLALAVELAAAFEKVPRWLAWTLRVALIASLGRIVLHGSVYLSGSDAWTLGQSFGVLTLCAALIAAVWALLAWLAERSPPGISLPLALALTIQCTGLAILLAGYVSGGASSLPLAAALVGAAAGARLLSNTPHLQAAVGIGMTGLSSLLLIGHFFGGLSVVQAIVLLLAPLLCWVTELPGLRNRPAWVVGSLRLALVAIPLAILLVLAKQEFDRETLPLLGQWTSGFQASQMDRK